MARIQDYIEGQFRADQREEVGIGGFTLMARVRERSTQTADVPTTFLEDGSHVNDHIILNPLTLSIEGMVSDVFVRPGPLQEIVRDAQRELGVITQYIPGRTASQLSRVSGIVNDLDSAIRRADSALDAGEQIAQYAGLQDATAQSNQEKFLDVMEGIRNSKALISIEMPFRTYERMCITSLEITRDNQMNALSFAMEAQQFRFAETVYRQLSAAPNAAAGNGGALDGETDRGAQEGEEVPSSFLFDLFGGGDD